MRNICKCLIVGAVLLLSGCGSITKSSGGSNPTSVLVITTTSLSNGTVGSAYTASITGTGGTTPYTYSASGLPRGLSISSTSGAITGTPAQGSIGAASVVATVTDSTQPTPQSATTTLSLTIQATKLAITTTSLPNAMAGSSYSASISTSGGVTPYSFSATGLPSGLSISDTTGAITGTPTQSSVGTASVVITVTDSTQPTPQSANAGLALTVNAAATPSACAGMSTGDDASLNGFVPFPATSPHISHVDCRFG